MAKLYFYYAAMNAGKSTMLLLANHNYRERGMRTLVFVPSLTVQEGHDGIIKSRLGLVAKAMAVESNFNFFEFVKKDVKNTEDPLACVLVDEAQFLTKKQVEELTDIADYLKIPVLAYGLRSDFQGELFEGSRYLLTYAEEMQEVKTMCHCGRKATMTMRVDKTGKKLVDGPQVQVGGNTMYIASCRMHHKEGQVLPFQTS